MTDPGILYIVATPLGNLEDMTFRAVKVLKSVGLVAAEDTRRTRKLLTHIGAEVQVISYREENHQKVLPKLIGALEKGTGVALVTDAGTPGISDPGALAVKEAVKAGHKVVPIPGPTAVSAALSVSGFPADSYLFAGFLPSKGRLRRDFLERLKEETRTLVFFEAPHRIVDSLEDLAAVLGDRKAVLCREMTKLHEEFVRGGLADLAGWIGAGEGGVKGEITLVVSGALPVERQRLGPEEIEKLVAGDDRPVKEIVADFSGLTDLSRSELYRLVLKATGKT